MFVILFLHFFHILGSKSNSSLLNTKDVTMHLMQQLNPEAPLASQASWINVIHESSSGLPQFSMWAFGKSSPHLREDVSRILELILNPMNLLPVMVCKLTESPTPLKPHTRHCLYMDRQWTNCWESIQLLRPRLPQWLASCSAFWKSHHLHMLCEVFKCVLHLECMAALRNRSSSWTEETASIV